MLRAERARFPGNHAKMLNLIVRALERRPLPLFFSGSRNRR